MNTFARICSRPALRRIGAWASVIGLSTMASLAAARAAGNSPAPAGDSRARSFVVFAGLDVFVDDRGTRQPVIGGSEGEVLVWDERKQATISMRNVALGATVEPRLARSRVTVDALKGYPVYSPGKDPAAAAQAQQFFLLNLEGARAEESEQNARVAQAVSDSFGSIAPSVSPDSPGAGAFQAQMNEAANQAVAATSEMASTYANPVYRDARIGSPNVEESFDGFAVAFVVSAPEPVSDAYGVLRLRLRAAGQPGAPVMHAMKLFRLRKLDAKPRKVVVRQFGLPPGFTMDSYQIHIYADGHELAANTSQNRVEVTEDEAHQFLILRHVQRHPTATMPAQVAQELQREMPAGITGGGLHSVLVDFDVTAEGKVAEVNAGAMTSGQLPTELMDELRQVRFLPALLNGKAVDSQGTFAVDELFRAQP